MYLHHLKIRKLYKYACVIIIIDIPIFFLYCLHVKIVNELQFYNTIGKLCIIRNRILK